MFGTVERSVSACKLRAVQEIIYENSFACKAEKERIECKALFMIGACHRRVLSSNESKMTSGFAFAMRNEPHVNEKKERENTKLHCRQRRETRPTLHLKLLLIKMAQPFCVERVKMKFLCNSHAFM